MADEGGPSRTPSLSEFRDAASKAEGNLRDISVIAPSFTNLETKGCHPVPKSNCATFRTRNGCSRLRVYYNEGENVG